MDIKVSKWFNNADSPVLLMIDDLANVWVDINNDGKVSVEGDWGYARNNKNSSFRYLKEVILNEFPKVKTTFFVPTGPRVGMIKNPTIKSISTPIDNDIDSITFYKEIHENPFFEIAYHGTTHGEVGVKSEDFLQEWETYKNLDHAMKTIYRGKEMHKKVIGEYPKGGKYCGYKAGEFGDESIEKTDFIWWNRFYNRGILSNTNCDVGEDYNKKTNFDIKFFGERNLVDIPSTISGDIYTNYPGSGIKNIIKRISKPYFNKKNQRELKFLLDNKLVISIQEHISPSRDDGKKQKPNIIDDTESLKRIFKYLDNKNIWHCTGTELAEYVLIRENINFVFLDESTFIIKLKISLEKFEFKNISIILDGKITSIKQPNQKEIIGDNGLFNLEILEGEYEVYK